jgi:hypothetical protein
MGDLLTGGFEVNPTALAVGSCERNSQINLAKP